MTLPRTLFVGKGNSAVVLVPLRPARHGLGQEWIAVAGDAARRSSSAPV